MKQTAVEWLVEQLPIRIINSYQSEIIKVLEMEKQQIIDAYVEGGRKGFNEFADDYEQYYNETFKKS
jgi:hypothetical protein